MQQEKEAPVRLRWSGTQLTLTATPMRTRRVPTLPDFRVLLDVLQLLHPTKTAAPRPRHAKRTCMSSLARAQRRLQSRGGPLAREQGGRGVAPPLPQLPRTDPA